MECYSLGMAFERSSAPVVGYGFEIAGLPSFDDPTDKGIAIRFPIAKSRVWALTNLFYS